MARYELTAYSTDQRYPYDVRYRAYTTSAKKADLFKRIPKIRFTDSGHGIVFSAREMMPLDHKKPAINLLADYVSEELLKLSCGRFAA